jgi:hypothetical protein
MENSIAATPLKKILFRNTQVFLIIKVYSDKSISIPIF